MDTDSSEQKTAEDRTGSNRGGRFQLLRRGFLGALGALTLGAGTAQGASTAPVEGQSRASDASPDADPRVLKQVSGEFTTRLMYSRRQLVKDVDTSPHESNDRVSGEAADDRLASDQVVSKFGKSLPHDDRTGLPTTEAYLALAEACDSGEGYADLQQASLDPEADDIDPSAFVEEADPKPLEQPETAWSYVTEGKCTAQLRMAVPPAFDSAEAGAEMIELYWRALTRDVPFREYDEHPLVQAATDELDGLDAYDGPGSAPGEAVTTENVFRGVTPGSEAGPYISQFLWKDRHLGRGTLDQRIETPAAEHTPRDYATDVDDWLKIQKGVVPAVDESLPGNERSGERRHIITGRDMTERVHGDPPFRQLQMAAQVLSFSMNVPLDEGIPYTMVPAGPDGDSRRTLDAFTSQTTLPFNDFGPLYVEKKVMEATEIAQKAAWYQKWNVHRRLRPEEFGGRVEATLRDDGRLAGDHPIPDALRESASTDGRALARTRSEFGSYLLPQAYAEGSPVHPSYPAGHSVVAGAGVTVLKTLFDGDYEFPAAQKVVPTEDGRDLLTAEETAAMDVRDTLTVRGELNKLASNIALGRNRAGIHYRSDGIEGLRLGESAAIRFLEDQFSLPHRVGDMHGGPVECSFETFNGEEVTVGASV